MKIDFKILFFFKFHLDNNILEAQNLLHLVSLRNIDDACFLNRILTNCIWSRLILQFCLLIFMFRSTYPTPFLQLFYISTFNTYSHSNSAVLFSCRTYKSLHLYTCRLDIFHEITVNTFKIKFLHVLWMRSNFNIRKNKFTYVFVIIL